MEREYTVSLCMIVKDEEKYLEKCLASVKNIVDEMIIVDTGSTDKTVKIAERFGAKIYYYPWDNSFSNARNYSLDKATKQWILIMDGDDEFETQDYEKFIHIINTSNKDGHFFNTISLMGDNKGKNLVSNLNIRLIRNNKKYKFVGSIHEQINLVNGAMDYNKFSSEDIKIYHYGYLPEVAAEKKKRNRNMTLIEEELKNDPDNPFHLFNLGNEYYAMRELDKALEYFNKSYELRDEKSGYVSKLVIRRVMCMEELSQYNKALWSIGEGLRLFPKFTDLEFLRGCIYLKMKKGLLAADSFKKCIELGNAPLELEFIDGCGTYRSYEALGELYLGYESYEEALIFFQKALSYNSKLQNILYKIGSILNKLNSNKRTVSYGLARYFDLEYVPNLILIADILIKEDLHDLALGYLEKAQEIDNSNNHINLLIGKALFYKGDYDNCKEALKKLPKSCEEYVLGLKYLFLTAIIHDDTEFKETLMSIKEGCCDFDYRIYLQIANVYQGNNEVDLKEAEDHEKYLAAVLDILDIILKSRKFELFERLLYTLNHLNSSRILIALAELYYRNGFKDMAVSEVLRSVKELDTIDAAAVEILYDKFCRI